MESTLSPRSTLFLCGCALAGGALARAQATPPRYAPEFLGAALGAAAMNDSAQVVGTVTSPAMRAFVASPGLALTLLPLPPGRVSSAAHDINESGAIAGAVSSSTSTDFGPMAAVWIPDHHGGYVVVELGMLAGHIGSQATALNDAGDIVGWSKNGMYRYPVLFGHPARADRALAIHDLTTTGIFDPTSINDQRVLVDSSFTVKRLDLNTMTVTDLGVPTGLPQNYMATRSSAINELNQVAGQAILATSTSCDRQAARFTDGVGWEIFSGCGPYNGAVDLNDLGDVVMQLNLYPYVRFEGLGTFRIEDLIDESGGHWYVINGYGLALNDARQMVVPAKNLVTNQTGLVLLTPQR
jgi:hypothetical protein